MDSTNNKHALACVRDLEDAALLRTLRAAAAYGRRHLAHLLRLLGEVEARRLYAPAGHASMFAFCCAGLGFSDAEAMRRITVARAARRHPALLAAIAAGTLHLTGASLIARHLDRGNVEALLAACARKSRRDIEAVVAQWFGEPQLPRRPVVRPLGPAAPRPALGTAAAPCLPGFDGAPAPRRQATSVAAPGAEPNGSPGSLDVASGCGLTRRDGDAAAEASATARAAATVAGMPTATASASATATALGEASLARPLDGDGDGASGLGRSWTRGTHSRSADLPRYPDGRSSDL